MTQATSKVTVDAEFACPAPAARAHADPEPPSVAHASQSPPRCTGGESAGVPVNPQSFCSAHSEYWVCLCRRGELRLRGEMSKVLEAGNGCAGADPPRYILPFTQEKTDWG